MKLWSGMLYSSGDIWFDGSVCWCFMMLRRFWCSMSTVVVMVVILKSLGLIRRLEENQQDNHSSQND